MKLHPLQSYTELYRIKKVESDNARTWATMASKKLTKNTTTDFTTAMRNLDAMARRVGEKEVTDQVNFMIDQVSKTITKNSSENNKTSVSN